MDSKYFGLVEMIFSGVVVLGFLGWQYWSINREIARDRARKASEEGARHPVGEHGLDDR